MKFHYSALLKLQIELLYRTSVLYHTEVMQSLYLTEVVHNPELSLLSTVLIAGEVGYGHTLPLSIEVHAVHTLCNIVQKGARFEMIQQSRLQP